MIVARQTDVRSCHQIPQICHLLFAASAPSIRDHLHRIQGAEALYLSDAAILCGVARVVGLYAPMRLKPPPNTIRHHEARFVHSKLPLGSVNQETEQMGNLTVHRS